MPIKPQPKTIMVAGSGTGVLITDTLSHP